MNKLDFPRIGESLYTRTLPNGLPIYVLPKKGFSRSVAMFATHYGGADRRFLLDGQWHDTPAGVAHFLEHKMFDMPDGSSALLELTARGASANAFTSTDVTAYYFSCTENFNENLELLLRYVSTPYFTEESVRKEQGIIAQEIRMTEDSPGTALYYGLLGCLYDHHPGRESVAGTVESIAEITPDILYACHAAFYRPCNMVLICIGDVDAEAICAMAEEILPKEEQERPVRDYGEPETLLPAEGEAVRKMSVSAPKFYMGAKVDWPEEAQARLRLMMTAELALQTLFGESSPFFTKLYAEGLLRRDFAAGLQSSAGAAFLLMGGESKDPDAVRAAVLEAVEQLRKEGFDEEDFERCRKACYGACLQSMADFSSLANSLMGSVFEGYLQPELFSVLPEISAEECRDFVLEYIREERLARSLVLPL